MSNRGCGIGTDRLLGSGTVVLFLVPLFLLLIGGCSSFTTLTNATKGTAVELTASDKGMRKKVGIAVLGHRAFPTHSYLEAVLQKALIERIDTGCPNIILVAPGDQDYPEFLDAPPRYASGRINSFELIRKGRQLGLNAIVTGESAKIREESKKRGFLWFKRTKDYASILATVSAYDTATGAKIFENALTSRIEISEADSKAIRAQRYASVPRIRAALVNAANEAGKKICEMMSVQRWKGFVVSAGGNRISISSGSESGLAPGDILEVYESARTIEGVASQRYYLPGAKTGELRIATVEADQAQAVPVSGAKADVGSLVLRRD